MRPSFVSIRKITFLQILKGKAVEDFLRNVFYNTRIKVCPKISYFIQVVRELE